ncbi:MAG: hypothetical protein LH472_05945 [Pyrinomonadaceae bacterium]|nr:hypothetical protein [Pyrinomonadaceae bacterium]
MNRSKAELLTIVGIFCCLFALIILIFNAAEISNFYSLPPLFFVGGIVLIVLSLAYHTEK